MPCFADRTSEALAYLRERFGVEVLPGRVVEKGDALWLTTVSEPPVGVPIHSLGVRLLRRQQHSLKPTSFGLMLLREHVRLRRVELSREELQALLLGRTLAKQGLSSGYVALCLDGEVLGCGHIKRGRLRCQIPTGRRRELLTLLEAEARRGV